MKTAIYRAQPTEQNGQHRYEVEVQRRVTQRSKVFVDADTPEEATQRVVGMLQEDWWEPTLHWEIHMDDIDWHEYLSAQVTCDDDDDRVEAEVDLSDFDDEIKSEPAGLPKLPDGTYRVVNGVIEVSVDGARETNAT